MLPQGYCPACEEHVEWQSIAVASGVVMKCSNCWHVVDQVDMATIMEMKKELDANQEKRNAIIAAYR
jgi:hypothetical protein